MVNVGIILFTGKNCTQANYWKNQQAGVSLQLFWFRNLKVSRIFAEVGNMFLVIQKLHSFFFQRKTRNLTAVISNDYPFAFDLLEKQVIMSTQVADASLQMPFTDHMKVLWWKTFYRQYCKSQFSHRSGIRIISFVIIECIEPSISNTIFTNEH